MKALDIQRKSIFLFSAFALYTLNRRRGGKISSWNLILWKALLSFKLIFLLLCSSVFFSGGFVKICTEEFFFESDGKIHIISTVGISDCYFFVLFAFVLVRQNLFGSVMVDKIGKFSVYLHNGWTQSLNLCLEVIEGRFL